MPTFVRLVRLTDKALGEVAQLGKMVTEARRIFEAHGCRLEHAWATLGPYDIVAVIHAPSEKIMIQASAEVAARGNFRAETLTAVPLAELAATRKGR